MFSLSGYLLCGIWVSSFSMAPCKPFKPPNNFKLHCLFGQQSKATCNVIESNNQGVIKVLKDKGKLIIHEWRKSISKWFNIWSWMS